MFSKGYHIIVIPKDPKKTKRLHLSKFTARLIAFGSLLILPVIVGSFFSTIYYQNQLFDLRNSVLEEKQLVEQKEIIATELTQLQRAMSRTEQSVNQLEAALDMDVGQMKKGLGPIDNDLEIEKSVNEVEDPSQRLGALLENSQDMSAEEVRSYISKMGKKIAGLQSKVEEMYEVNLDKIRFLNATPNMIPVAGWITSGFGFRRSPYSGRYKMHYGIDIASPVGTNVMAPADGQVILADIEQGYGRKVVIDHGFGVVTAYGHASKLFVKEGQIVKRGEIVASVGSSGASTGPHLHYEVHVDGIPTDPLQYIWK